MSDLSAQSDAHVKSAYTIIDPTYGILAKIPLSDIKTTGASWIYGPAELECWRLQVRKR